MSRAVFLALLLIALTACTVNSEQKSAVVTSGGDVQVIQADTVPPEALEFSGKLSRVYAASFDGLDLTIRLDSGAITAFTLVTTDGPQRSLIEEAARKGYKIKLTVLPDPKKDGFRVYFRLFTVEVYDQEQRP